MGRYVMKQNWFSWGNDYTVQDAQGQDVFFIDGRAFSFGDNLSFQDMAGRELAFISQKLLSWGPTYEISRGDELVAVVRKSLFTLFKCEFIVDVPGPDDLVATGSFWEHEYEFTRHGVPVAQVSKRYFAWTDTYGIDVAPEEDDVLIVASAAVIDLCCHEKRK